MPKLWYATSNPGKVTSLKQQLEPAGFDIEQVNMFYPEPRMDLVERMAVFKAASAFQELKAPVVANDAGFFIRSLKGYPGANVNFALKTIDLDGILRLVHDTDRSAFFRHALAYDDGQGNVWAWVDEVHGSVTREIRGVFDPTFHWSKLVLIFLPDGETKTLGEMPYDEYQDWSAHRAPRPRCAEQFLVWYADHRSALV